MSVQLKSRHDQLGSNWTSLLAQIAWIRFSSAMPHCPQRELKYAETRIMSPWQTLYPKLSETDSKINTALQNQLDNRLGDWILTNTTAVVAMRQSLVKWWFTSQQRHQYLKIYNNSFKSKPNSTQRRRLTIHMRLGDIAHKPSHTAQHDATMRIWDALNGTSRAIALKDFGEKEFDTGQTSITDTSMMQTLAAIFAQYPEYKDYSIDIVTAPGSKTSLPFPIHQHKSEDDALEYLRTANVLVMSRSTFSLTALYLFEGQHVFIPTWAHHAASGLGSKYDIFDYPFAITWFDDVSSAKETRLFNPAKSMLRSQWRPPNRFQYPPFLSGKLLEEAFSGDFQCSEPNIHYIDAWWTNLYCHADFMQQPYNRAELQSELDGLVDLAPSTHTFFTIVQHDDGIREKLPKGTIVFHCGRNNSSKEKKSIFLPLIYEDDQDRLKKAKSRRTSEVRTIFMSFMGRITHPIRREMFTILAHEKGFQIVESTANNQDWVTQMADSKFALCPVGYGPNSFRYVEAMQMGCVPVWIGETTLLPMADFLDPASEPYVIHAQTPKDLLSPSALTRLQPQQHLIAQLARRHFSMDGVIRYISRQLQPSIPRLSVVIPTYNRFHTYLKETIIGLLRHPVVDEIVIVDDASNDTKAFLSDASIGKSFKDHHKLRWYRQEKNMGAFKNKMAAVALARNIRVLLLDSDNDIPESTLRFIGSGISHLDEDVILSPSFAKPALDYRQDPKQDNFSLKDFGTTDRTNSYLNLGNYVVDRNFYCHAAVDILSNKAYAEIDPGCYDVAWMTYHLCRSGAILKKFEDFVYEHRMHSDSLWVKTHHEKEAWYFKWMQTGIDYQVSFPRKNLKGSTLHRQLLWNYLPYPILIDPVSLSEQQHQQQQVWKSYSQSGQDIFAYCCGQIQSRLFAEHSKKIFLDIGAYDGKHLSNSFALSEQSDWKGICVEANPDIFKKLVKEREGHIHNTHFIQVAATSKKGFIQFIPDGVTGMTTGSVYEEKSVGPHYNTVKVPAKPIKTILEELAFKTGLVTFLSLDIEGGEYDALQGIDWSTTKFIGMCVEHNNYSRGPTDKNKIYKFLTEKGYARVVEDHAHLRNPYEDWYLHKAAVDLFDWALFENLWLKEFKSNACEIVVPVVAPKDRKKQISNRSL